jgi:hypothetical protein
LVLACLEVLYANAHFETNLSQLLSLSSTVLFNIAFDKHGKPLSTNGYRYVLTVIDFFSNYVEVFPLQRKEAAEVSDNI